MTATEPPIALPASAFSVAFGLAGLASVWRLAAQFLAAPDAIATILTMVALAVWLLLVIMFGRRIASGRTSLHTELTHPITAPFLALIPITILVLVPEISRWSSGVAGWLAWLAIATVLPLGAWLTGQWVGFGVPEKALHSGYYLPTVAAGLIAAAALATLSEDRAALMAFGLGGICWLLIGSIINNRNFVVESLPPALVPTMAIDVAPVVVAGNAWFVITSGEPDMIQLALAGFAVLMVMVQLRLIPVYRGLRFSLSFWAFTFSYCAVASYGMRWLATTDEAWAPVLSWALVVVITGFVGWIAGRSLLGLRAGTLLPREVPAPVAS